MKPPSEAPSQHKQTSRKGKKAWRKHVDVSDIQIGLENAREEIIHGGIISKRPSSELYAVDTEGSDNIKKSYNKGFKPFKSDEILASRSAVPAVDSRKRTTITDGDSEPTSKRRKGNGVSHKEYERLRKLAYGGEYKSMDALKLNEQPMYDPWLESSNDSKYEQNFDFLDKPKPIRLPSTLKEAPISLVEGSTSYPAVPKPRAGKSYNPMFDDWNQILIEEGNKEIEAEQKRLKDAEEEHRKLDRIIAAEERDGYLTEEESAWEGIESEYEGQGQEAERSGEATKAEREDKKRAQQAQKIKEIAREVKRKEQARASVSKALENPPTEVGEDAVLRRRPFGNTAIPNRPLELVLPDELQDSLRLLKPEGNLLDDRFRNVMLRGKVENRKPIHQPKKAQRKATDKWTSKDFTITV